MKKIIVAVCLGFFITLIFTGAHFENTHSALAGSVIRFHVIANSDSEEDQELKLKVRNAVIERLSDLFNGNGDINAAREVICENLANIEKTALNEIKKNGFSYTVKVSLGKSDFPTKEYGNLVLPAGSYEAVKIEIGKAQGQNWWCVLFPPLCFVEESCVSDTNEARKIIEKNAGKKTGSLVSKNKNPEAQIKFKIYEMWQTGKRRLAMMFG